MFPPGTDPLEDLGIGVGCFTAEATAVYLNSVVCEALGRPREELVGKNADELFSPEIVAELHRRIAEVLQLGKPLRHQDKVPLPHGERWFVSVYSVMEHQDEPRVMVAVTDVTHFRDEQEALIESEARGSRPSWLTRVAWSPSGASPVVWLTTSITSSR